MNRRHATYALAAALVGAGAVWAGVPIGTVLVLALVLACPLMMLHMHDSSGHLRHHAGHREAEHHQHRPRRADPDRPQQAMHSQRLE